MVSSAVIITSDDLGRWPEVNDAVMAGYDAGVISSAGLRVNGQAARSAIVSASMRSGLGVGLHLVLCEGSSTLPRHDIPNLVDAGGRFVSRPLEAAWLYRRGGGLRDELAAEIRAQVERFLSSGLYLTHVSSTYDLHLHPTILGILKDLALEYPLWAIRKPCGKAWKWSRRYNTPGWQTALENSVMRPVLGYGRLRSRCFKGPDRVEPLSRTRPITEHSVVERLNSLKSGVTEFVCHPGSFLRRYDGIGEAAVLTSPMVRASLEANDDVDLISYREVTEGN
ncbi:MAG: carbohydrate deacetylase [Candidatus Binatia bacterium]